MERLLDQAAREMKLDPAEIRRRNFIAPSAFPYRTHMGDTYDAGEFARILDRVLAASDWNGFEAKKEEVASRTENCAGAAWRPTSSGPARCRPRRWTSRSPPTAR